MRKLLLVSILALAACEYPTESVRIISVHCIAGDSVFLPAGDSVDVVLPCIDPRELDPDSVVPDA